MPTRSHKHYNSEHYNKLVEKLDRYKNRCKNMAEKIQELEEIVNKLHCELEIVKQENLNVKKDNASLRVKLDELSGNFNQRNKLIAAILEEIKPYDGSSDFLRWLNQLNYVMSENLGDLSSEIDFFEPCMAKILRLKITGWASVHVEGQFQLITRENFKEVIQSLIENFGEEVSVESTRDKLFSVEFEKGKIPDFVSKVSICFQNYVEAKATKLGRKKDEIALLESELHFHALRNGLPNALRSAVDLSQPKTYDDLRTALLAIHGYNKFLPSSSKLDYIDREVGKQVGFNANVQPNRHVSFQTGVNYRSTSRSRSQSRSVRSNNSPHMSRSRTYSRSKSNSPNQARIPILCFRCGNYGHKANVCKTVKLDLDYARRQKDAFFMKYPHLEPKYKPRNQNVRADRKHVVSNYKGSKFVQGKHYDSNDRVNLVVGNVNQSSENRGEIPFVWGKVTGLDTKIIFDTGAGPSCISDTFVEKLKSRANVKITESGLQLQTATGEQAATGYCALIKYSYYGVTFWDKFHIVKRSQNAEDNFLLLGNDVLQKFGFVGIDYTNGYVVLDNTGLALARSKKSFAGTVSGKNVSRSNSQVSNESIKTLPTSISQPEPSTSKRTYAEVAGSSKNDSISKEINNLDSSLIELITTCIDSAIKLEVSKISQSLHNELHSFLDGGFLENNQT